MPVLGQTKVRTYKERKTKMGQRKSACFLMTAVALMAVLSMQTGCTRPNDKAEAVLDISVSALSKTDIERLVVTVTGDGINPPIAAELPEEPDDHWSGNIQNIPAGDSRTFLAEAFDINDEVIYSGSATNVSLGDGETVAISIYLQPVNPPAPFENSVPIIEAFTMSPFEVLPGQNVELGVQAIDSDPEDTLAILWTATGGAFSNSDEPSTTWSCPTTAGVYEITVSVSDPHGATAVLSISITTGAVGNAKITIVVNNPPEVQNLVPAPTRIDAGESTNLDLTVMDPDADPLLFTWSANCTGTFSDVGVKDPTFTLTTLTGTSCTLTVDIEDSAGGTNQASITIETGPEVAPSLPYRAISAGWDHTCGLRDDRSVVCWGTESTSPEGEFVQIGAGEGCSCGVKTDGTLACWGATCAASPPSGQFEEASAGNFFACALSIDGSIACWGSNCTGGRCTPPGGRYTQVSSGQESSCGLLLDGTVACWGSDQYGQSTPPTGQFTQVSTGAAHACGIRSNGTVVCWGCGDGVDYGQCAPPAGQFEQISAGALQTCGLKADGSVVCWGCGLSGDAGQCTPPASEFIEVSTGSLHTCGVRANGTVTCWGSDQYGQSTVPD